MRPLLMGSGAVRSRVGACAGVHFYDLVVAAGELLQGEEKIASYFFNDF